MTEYSETCRLSVRCFNATPVKFCLYFLSASFDQRNVFHEKGATEHVKLPNRLQSELFSASGWVSFSLDVL